MQPGKSAETSRQTPQQTTARVCPCTRILKNEQLDHISVDQPAIFNSLLVHHLRDAFRKPASFDLRGSK